MQKQDVVDFLKLKPGYQKVSKYKLSIILKCDVDICKEALREFKKKPYEIISIVGPDDFGFKEKSISSIDSKVLKLMKEGRFKEAEELVLSSVKVICDAKSRVLVIGDLHAPFENKDYLAFCIAKYKEFNCDRVVFIGDIIDNHYSSFHPSDPDGYGAGEELDRAIDIIAKWYKAFPVATVIIGNHDRLAYRKAFDGGISKRWVRKYNEVLNTPNWTFTESIVIDNVMYVHGEGGTARAKCKEIQMSTVQGHLHSQAYIEFAGNNIFAMQVGTGVDSDSYAFGYAKAGKESVLSCGIVVEGKQPYLCKM